MAIHNLLICFRSSIVLNRINKANLGLFGNRAFSSLASTYRDTLTVPDPKVSTLKNKLKVATDENSSEIATVGLWIDVGSRYESEKLCGCTHLIEHLIFKGTAKRSQIDLENEVAKKGLSISSHIARDHMAIYAKCLSKNIPEAVEILSDMVQNSSFTDADIEKEKHTLHHELNATDSDLTTVVMDFLHSSAFQGTTYARSEMGTSQSIKNLSKTDLKNFYNMYFMPTRMVLTGAGGVKHDELLKLGDKHFGEMSPNYKGQLPLEPPTRFTGSEIRARYDDEPLCHIALAVEGPGFMSDDNLVLDVATSLIGSWDKTVGGGKHMANHMAYASSQVELCHAFQSFNIAYPNTGLWGAYFICDRMTISDMFFNLQGEWMRICTSASEQEVERAKKALKTKLFGHFNDSTLQCEDIAKQVLFMGRRIPYEELDSRIDSITSKTIREVAYKYVYDKCPVLVSYGPTEQVPDYNRVRSAMYWLRF